MRKTISALVFLSISLLPAHAQQGPWPLIQECMLPHTPPEGWTFDGTLLMQGQYGIHAFNTAWETPRVQIWMDDSAQHGGGLSPDGQWYAYPYGEFYVTETWNQITTAKELRIRSTSDDREYTIPVFWHGYGGTYGQTHWLNNEGLVFPHMTEGTQYIAPFGDEPLVGQFSLNIQDTMRFFPSPDWQRAVRYDVMADWILDDIAAEPVERLAAFEWNGFLQRAAWSPDGETFAVALTANTGNRIDLYDENGQQADTVYIDMNPYLIIPNLEWSPDGRYLTFIAQKKFEYGFGAPYRLYLADMLAQAVIDPCVTVDTGVAWSPDSSQLAFLGSGDVLTPIRIWDVDARTIYTVARYTVTPDAYRTNDSALMLGWRVP